MNSKKEIALLIFITVIIVAAVLAVSKQKQTYFGNGTTIPEKLLALEYANPYEEFESDFSNGTAKFIGIQGYGLYFPGIANSGDIYDKYEYWIAWGESDHIISYEHFKLTDITEHYAEIYNMLLADRLKINTEYYFPKDSECYEGSVLPDVSIAVASVMNMDSVEKSDAPEDARKAIAGSDLRYIAVGDKNVCLQCKFEDCLQMKDNLNVDGYKLIRPSLSSAPADSYEHKRRYWVAMLYASEYNDRIYEELRKREGIRLMKTMDGFEKIKTRFHWHEPDIGYIHGCKGKCFLIDLYSTGSAQSLLDSATWDNSYKDGRVGYDWNDFLKAFDDANEVINMNIWLKELKEEGQDRRLKLTVSGDVPHAYDHDYDGASLRWKKDKLDSEPYYEIDFGIMDRSNEGRADNVIDCYISKDGKKAIIIVDSSSIYDSKGDTLLESGHWIFKRLPQKPYMFYLIIDNEARTYYYSDRDSEIHHF